MMTKEDIEALIALVLFFGGGLLTLVGALFTFGFWPVVTVVGLAMFLVGINTI